MIRPLAAFLLLVLAALFAPLPAAAVQPDERLDDAAMESRAREISADLRCLVCQNQSIDDSNAPLARDLRLLVRERLLAGDSDEQVVEFVRSRYGDYVLLEPPLKLSTLVLWFGGPAVLVVAGAALWLWLGRRNVAAAAAGPAPLDAAEQRRLDDLLGGEDG